MSSEKHAIRRAFSLAAPQYNAVAKIQRQILVDLIAALQSGLQGAHAGRLLDAGCGTGLAARELGALSDYHALDLALPMLQQHSHGTRCAGDIEHLPYRNASFNHYFSSLAWQWTEPSKAIQEAARVLTPGGHLHVATLGPDTLRELRHAFRAADDKAHLRDFPSPLRYPSTLQAAGFVDIQLTRQRYTLWEADVATILRQLRQLGARVIGAPATAPRGLFGKQSFARLVSAYEAYRQSAGLPVHYDAVLISARKT